MILLDTSVWVEYLRATGSSAAVGVRELLGRDPDIVAICEPVAMELLAGAADDQRHARLERLVNGLPVLATDTHVDFRQAADLYRAGRKSGRTVRSLVDCLIASIAIRHDVELWHRDADFDVIASLASLRTRSFVSEGGR